MKMKTVAKRFLVLSQALLLAFGGAACSGKVVDGGEGIDETKTQLYVSAYDAGYGQMWLDMYKEKFEALYADHSFEDDKMGVQVMIDWNQGTGQNLIAQMNGADTQVYFNVVDYYDLVSSGNALNLTEILNEDLGEFGESGKNVMGKIPTDIKSYFESVNGGVYAVPSTETWNGIQYNIDLFEEEGFYFASEYDEATPEFTTGLADDLPKAKGPDNLPNTFDDGLPATINQFYQLLDYMLECNVIPFTFTESLGYAEMLPWMLFVNFQGKKELDINFSFRGTAESLIDVDKSGNVTPLPPTEINDSNAYMLMKQKGFYQALQVVEKLINKKGESYFSPDAFSGDQNHIAAQEEYLYSEIFAASDSTKRPIAFLVEGTYWQAEAVGIFEDIEGKYGKGDQYSINKRRFGVMPLPHFDESRVGQKNTILAGTLNCFARGGQKGAQLEVTKKFIQFINTDPMILNYVKEAGYLRGVNVEFTKDDIKDLTPYAQNLLTVKQNSDVLHPVSTNPIWVANATGATQWQTRKNGWLFVMNGSNMSPVTNFYNNGVLTASDYFNGMYTNMKGRWSTLKK